MAVHRLPGETEIISDVPEPSSIPAFTPPSLLSSKRSNADGEFVEAAPVRTGARKQVADEPVSARIRRKAEEEPMDCADRVTHGISRAFGAVMS